MISSLFARVHTLDGHAGVGATLALVCDCFHWPSIAQDTRLLVLFCGINRRKRSRSQKLPRYQNVPWNRGKPMKWTYGQWEALPGQAISMSSWWSAALRGSPSGFAYCPREPMMYRGFSLTFVGHLGPLKTSVATTKEMFGQKS